MAETTTHTDESETVRRLKEINADLLEALYAYHDANRLHNDAEAELWEQGAKAIEKATGLRIIPNEDGSL